MKFGPWTGIAAAGVGAAMLLIPHSETYQSTMFYEYIEVKIDCGNPVDSNVSLSDGAGDFIGKDDQVFEGKSANRVCEDLDSKNRTTALIVIGVGAVAFVAAVASRRSKQAPSFTPRAVPVGGPAPARATAAAPAKPAAATVASQAAVANPARWATDPFARHELRYWNGTQWTDHVSDHGVVSPDPAVATPTSLPSPLAPPSVAPVAPVPPPSVAPVAPAVVAPLAPPPIAAVIGEPATNPHDADEHDHHTVRRSSLQSPPAAVHAPIRLEFDSGQGTTLQEPLVIGRNPSPVAELPTAGLLSYEDPTMSVSKTHLAIGQEAGAVWVEDLGSSNGTTVVDAAGQATVVAPRARTAVPLGATIRFGDRWVQVRRQGVDGE